MYRLAYGTWNERALCKNRDPRIYHLEGRGRPTQKRAERACRGCPVKRECAKDTLIGGDWGVIRGGIAVYSRSRATIELLEYVVEHGILPEQAAIDNPAAIRCVECDQRLRPFRARAMEYPGTTKRGGARDGRDYCESCWKLAKEKGQWAA